MNQNAKRMAWTFMAALQASNALAGAGTISVKDAGGTSRVFDVVTDGSGNFAHLNALCDGVACANIAAIKAGTTAAALADPALVVAVSPNNTVAVTQSGTWTTAATQSGTWTTSAIQSGTWTTSAIQSGTWTTAVSTGKLSDIVNVESTIGAGTAPASVFVIGCQYNTASPTPTNAQTLGCQFDSSGSIKVNVTNANANGQATMANSSPTVIASDQSAVSVKIAAATVGGVLNFVLEPAASDNHTVIKNGTGMVYGIHVFNNTSVVNYGRLYDLGSGFNGCGSTASLKHEFMIPASTSGAGFVVPVPQGITFTAGISICVTSGYGQTNTTAATATSIVVNVQYL